jgi:hypothetical protein
MRLFVNGIADRVANRKDRELKREKDEQEIYAMKLNNAERWLDLAKGPEWSTR